MTLVSDQTSTLLAVGAEQSIDTTEPLLTDVSRAVVTLIALRAKAEAYDQRLTRALIGAFRGGASLTELCDAAGMSREAVLIRLSASPTPPAITPTDLDHQSPQLRLARRTPPSDGARSPRTRPGRAARHASTAPKPTSA